MSEASKSDKPKRVRIYTQEQREEHRRKARAKYREQWPNGKPRKPDGIERFEFKGKIYTCRSYVVKECERCGEDFVSGKRFNQRFCSGKCSAKTTMNDPKVKAKTKATNQERYGGNSPACSKEVQEKAKRTFIDKYGVDNPAKSSQIQAIISEKVSKAYEERGDEILAKAVATWQKNYGVDYASQSPQVQAKVEATNMARYGVKNVFQAEWCKEKMARTNLANLGVEFPSQSPECREKGKQTLIEHYGVDHPMKIPEMMSAFVERSKDYWAIPENREAQRLRQIENLKNRQYDKITLPEQIMIDLLDHNGIPYEFQYNIQGFLYDFYLLGTNIVIEVDGDYWHGNTAFYPILNEMQTANIQKDQIKSVIAHNHGYDLHRFWESDLKNEDKLPLIEEAIVDGYAEAILL